MPVSVCRLYAGEDPTAVTEGDVLVLRAECELPVGAADALAEVAAGETGVATVSPVVGDRRPAMSADTALPPRVLAPAQACALVTRAAIDLCGPVDDGFARRCSAAGLQHLLAPGVTVRGPADPPPEDRYSAHARALRRVRLSDSRPSVTIDGRSLTERITGTQVHVLELIAALRRDADVHLRVIVPDEPGEHARALLEGLDTITYEDVRVGVPRTDVVHRPHQVTSDSDLGVLTKTGERIVITHQDLIAYRNPAYHATEVAWTDHRRHTRMALALADLVVFGSPHAERDARAEDLVSAARTAVVPIGTDHHVLPAPAPARPARAPDGAFLLVLGTDYRHKNRVFAMDLLAELRARGWNGALVLAGGRVERGGTAGEERGWAAAHPDVPVTDLGPVGEAEKRWLYEQAAAVVYPTTYEGFGLIPFEAAAHGTASLWAPVTSLADVLDPALATLVPWDPAASAERSLAVLRDPGAQVAAVRTAAEGFSWARAAGELDRIYRRVADLPGRAAATAAEDALSAEAARAAWEARYWDLWQEIGPAGLSLVAGEDPLLSPEHRNVLAGLLRRRATGRPVRAALRGAGRLKR